MKKSIALIAAATVLLVCSVCSYAQDSKPCKGQRPNPEQILDRQSLEMATLLELEGDKAESFVAIYKSFKSEIFKVRSSAKRYGKDATDEEIEASIKEGFEISHKVLDIREAYYDKFRTVLTPAQIRKMYFHENCKGSAHMQHHGGHGPGHGHGAPAGGSRGHKPAANVGNVGE